MSLRKSEISALISQLPKKGEYSCRISTLGSGFTAALSSTGRQVFPCEMRAQALIRMELEGLGAPDTNPADLFNALYRVAKAKDDMRKPPLILVSRAE